LLVRLDEPLELSHGVTGPLCLLGATVKLLKMPKGRDRADLVAGKVIDEVGYDLSFVVVPVQIREERRPGDALLKEAAKVGLVPVDGTERFLQCYDRCW